MEPLSQTQIHALSNKVVEGGASDLLCANLAGRMRFANTSACTNLGYSLSDLLMKGIADYTPSYTQAHWESHCQRTIANGSDRIYTYHQGCDGDLYPVEVNSIPYVLDETREQLICSLVQKVKKSERYQEMLEAGERATQCGTFQLNITDQSLIASNNLLAIMGTNDPEDLRPSVMVDRLSNEDASRWNVEMTRFLGGYHSLNEKFVMTTAGGRESLVRVNLWSVLNDGKVTGINGVYQLINSSAKVEMVSLAENQRRHIIRALRYTNGRVTGPKGAAKILKINGKTLFARMKKLDIKREDYHVRK